jgi:DNA-directed RNA polymerase subunit RPC12/RpoP
MAIEFRCTKCNKLLRTGDDTAGKHARCPECGEVLLIPAGGTPFSAPLPSSSPPPASGSGGFPPPPPSGPTGGNPFVAGEQPQYQPDSNNPYQSPSAFASMPEMPAGATEIRPTIIDLGDVMGRAWRIFKEQWGMCLAAVVVVGICNAAFGFLTGKLLPFLNASADFNNIPPQQMYDAVIKQLPRIMFLGTIKGYVDLLFTAWTSIGLGIVFLKIARGQQASIGDIFSGGKYYVNMLITMVLFGIMINIGYLLLIVPGVILYLMFHQYYYLIIDRNLGIVESLEMSKTITTGNKMTLFLIGLVCLGISVSTIVTCGLGMLIAAPYFALLNAVIYLSMTGQPTVDQVRAGMGVR